MLAILACFAWSSSTFAQGYGGLGTKAEGFENPSRDHVFTFPRDHGAHEGFRIEWWYLTANLRGEDGKDYGVQWTLFRSALAPLKKGETQPSGWLSPQVWMGHAAVTGENFHHVSETRARGGVGLAGARHMPFEAWINDWQMKSTAPTGRDQLSALKLTASGEQFTYDLNLSATGPLIFHGDKGYSVKSSGGQASHYYSQPFYKVSGELNLPSGAVRVTGNAWLDREWSSQPLSEDQKGWDWVSLSFKDGSKLMGFSLRQKDGDHFTSATWITPEGKTVAYRDGALTMTPKTITDVAGRRVPTGWSVKLLDQNVDVDIAALNPKAWMKTSFPYWEGPVKIKGSHEGVGYLEMTGYEADK